MVELYRLGVAGTSGLLHNAVAGYNEEKRVKNNVCQQADCNELVLFFFIMGKED